MRSGRRFIITVIVMRSVGRFLIFVVTSTRSPVRFLLVVDLDHILDRRPVVVGDRFGLDDVLDTAGVGGNSHPGNSDARVAGRRTADDRPLLLLILVLEAALCKYVGHVKPSLGVRSLVPVWTSVRGRLRSAHSASSQPPPSSHFERRVKSSRLESEPLAEDGLLLFVHDGHQFVINYRQLGLGQRRHLIL